MDIKNNVLARISEPSNDDYDNGVSDNCDQNFGTYDDFGVKNDQKVSHNMTLMSKYKGQHGGKKGKKIRARSSPPPFRAMPERNRFFLWEVFPNQSSDDICSMMKYETYDSSDGKAVLESGDEVSSATAQSLKEEQQGGDQLQMSVWNFLDKVKVF